jgi:hypothetical protein
VQRIIKQNFIAVVADDWYQRRRQDAEGEFFRKVADQGPQKGIDGSTRQGIYCLTADGKLLSFKNAGQNAEATLDSIQQALREWKKLPANRRKPGAVKVEAQPATDDEYHRTMPKGAQVFEVFTRLLEKTDDGYKQAECKVGKGDQPGRDHFWLTKQELADLADPNSKPGSTKKLPKFVERRIARFHLLDNVRGEPPMWDDKEVRNLEITLKCKKVDAEKIVWAIEGEALMHTNRDDRGCNVKLGGEWTIDRSKKRVIAGDLVAFGEHWGESPLTRGAPPGKTPIGIVFTLPKDEKLAEQVPPQFARHLRFYLEQRF